MLAVALGVVAFLVAAVGNTQWHINPSLLTYLSGFAVPLAVGVLTKWHVSSGVKAVCNVILSAIAGALAVAIASNGDVVLSTWIGGFVQTLVVSIASYYGFWKPTGIAQTVQLKTANFGIGGPPPAALPPPPPVRDDILPTEVPEPSDAVAKQARPLAAKKVTTAKKAGPKPRK